METVRSADGTPIAYWRSGAGSPLLLVHGTTCDHTIWADIQPALERLFSVCAMDRRGRGQSGDTAPYAHRRELEDIAAVIDSIGGPVNVLGHSFGALCSLEAMLLASNVRRVILYEPPMAVGGRALSPELDRRMQASIDAGEKAEALLLFFREVLQMNEHEVAAAQSSPGWSASVATAHTVPRECKVVDGYTFDPKRFRDMQVPTMFFVGGDSPAAQHGIAETAHAAISGSQIVLLPGQQHWALNAVPDLFVRDVVKYLR
jgi:pimeloyl-ACP methyl ester carboxylesterase